MSQDITVRLNGDPVVVRLGENSDQAATAALAAQAAAEASEAAAEAALNAIGAETVAGWPDPIVATGDDVPSGYTMIMQTPAVGDGIISQATIGLDSGGTVTIQVVEMNVAADTVTTVVSSTDVTFVAGSAPKPLSIPIFDGQFVAVHDGGYKFQDTFNPEGIRAWLKVGAISAGNVLEDSIQHRFEVQIVMSTGLYGAQTAGTVAIAGTGLDVLSAADTAGLDDATAIFAAGRTSHPFPYMRPGAYALTDIPAHGEGLYGPGLPAVDGTNFFTPERADLINWYYGIRQALAEHIAAGDVLGLVGDSISHFAYAADGADHWFNQFTAFANLDIAADEPIMTALRSSSTYTPAFYGVTVTGGSTGTAGPIIESLILASGNSLAFTGVYETIGAFFQRVSGAGSMVFKRGATTLATVSAAGATENDRYSGDVATGVTSTASYTIEASGGAVELTGLVRLGVKAAGSPPRLYTGRFAHGGYAFSHFDTAQRASIVKQATFKGGKLVPIIALGTNDMFTIPPASFVATATAMIDAFEAAGCDHIYAIPPFRPTSAWDSTFTGGRTYDAAIGLLRKLYRARGVEVFPWDMRDWAGAGELQDGLHPASSGQPSAARLSLKRIIERA